MDLFDISSVLMDTDDHMTSSPITSGLSAETQFTIYYCSGRWTSPVIGLVMCLKLRVDDCEVRLTTCGYYLVIHVPHLCYQMYTCTILLILFESKYAFLFSNVFYFKKKFYRQYNNDTDLFK